jgi:pimeloyl-ACP methyl ester carboxylesterase
MPRVEFVDCAFQIPDGRAAQCGQLTAPETPGLADGRLVRLPFVIFKAARENGEAPLVFLHGGPGEPAGIDPDGIKGWWALIDQSGWLKRQDLIVFEQRGTGLAEPSLKCPEMQKAGYEVFVGALSDEAATARWAESAKMCRDRLIKSGIRLESYNTETSAGDLSALLGGLPYSSWNLYGVSYGTRLALAFLRQHPAGTRSVILDSVYPPNVHAYVEAPGNAARAFAALFNDCAARASCRNANPDLAASFRTLALRAGVSPLQTPIASSAGDAQADPVVAPLDSAKLIEVLFGGFYSWRDISQLPGIISAASRGDMKPLAPLAEEALETYKTEDFSYGLFLSTECHDDWSYDTPAAIQAAASGADIFSAFARANLPLIACPVWSVGRALPAFHEPVRSDTPILILTGEYDPITPPDWAVTAAATLSQSIVIRFPGIGHGILASHRCADELALRFLGDPSKSPYHDCLVAVAAGPWDTAVDASAHKPLTGGRSPAAKANQRR